MSAKIDISAVLNAASVARADGPGSTGLAGKLKQAASSGDIDGIREAAQKFEGYFVQMMFKEMRKAQASEDGLFSGTAMETFSDLFDEEIAGRVSEGRGIGLANHIFKSLVGPDGIPGGASALGSGEGRGKIHVPAQVFGGTEGAYSWPLPKGQPGSITSDYGMRQDPFGRGHRHHRGLDISAPAGTPVLAMAAGEVLRSDRSPTYGNVVYVDHGQGVVTRYAHQERLDVVRGDRVVRGQQLGTVGSTGRSTGPHLHLEVRVGGKAVDPQEFLGQAEH
jgi:murein DD-endopeptidase MepM/ murein hydrolase activator NlpD